MRNLQTRSSFHSFKPQCVIKNKYNLPVPNVAKGSFLAMAQIQN